MSLPHCREFKSLCALPASGSRSTHRRCPHAEELQLQCDCYRKMLSWHLLSNLAPETRKQRCARMRALGSVSSLITAPQVIASFRIDRNTAWTRRSPPLPADHLVVSHRAVARFPETPQRRLHSKRDVGPGDTYAMYYPIPGRVTRRRRGS